MTRYGYFESMVLLAELFFFAHIRRSGGVYESNTNGIIPTPPRLIVRGATHSTKAIIIASYIFYTFQSLRTVALLLQ